MIMNDEITNDPTVGLYFVTFVSTKADLGPLWTQNEKLEQNDVRFYRKVIRLKITLK